jgi:hypothetical protein
MLCPSDGNTEFLDSLLPGLCPPASSGTGTRPNTFSGLRKIVHIARVVDLLHIYSIYKTCVDSIFAYSKIPINQIKNGLDNEALNLDIVRGI